MPSSAADHVAIVRRFHRFYTRKIGVLREGLLHSPYSLTEVRLLFELAHRERPTASEIVNDLGLDPGQLSRTVKKLAGQGLLTRTRSPEDGRQRFLELTPAGRQAFADLDQRSSDEVADMLATLSTSDQEELVETMRRVEELLTPDFKYAEPFVLRPLDAGDMGWVVHRHGALYATEFGWDARFEALVAEIAAAFLTGHDPSCERGWIAERNREKVGSVFVVRESDAVAKLRLLLVEPSARGLGLGTRLVDECVAFARGAGYQSLTLWTNDVLEAAGRIYTRAGFRLVAEEPHENFGPPMVGQTWELDLLGAPP